MSNWRTVLTLFLCGIGVAVSLSTVVFFFYGNFHAAVWALISGILAAVDFHIVFLHWRRTLSSWHTPSSMNDIEILGLACLFCGLAGTFWYIFMFLYYNLPILPVPDSYQIAAVWAFMTAKWGLGLYLSARHLGTNLQEEYPDLLPSPSYARSPHYYARITGATAP